MASATTISIAATANVIRIPAATAFGRAVVMSIVADASANTAPITDAPAMSPRLRDRSRQVRAQGSEGVLDLGLERALNPALNPVAAVYAPTASSSSTFPSPYLRHLPTRLTRAPPRRGARAGDAPSIG